MPDSTLKRIIRTWHSVLTAYPEALTPFCVRETARRANVSKADVLTALGHSF